LRNAFRISNVDLLSITRQGGQHTFPQARIPSRTKYGFDSSGCFWQKA